MDSLSDNSRSSAPFLYHPRNGNTFKEPVTPLASGGGWPTSPDIVYGKEKTDISEFPLTETEKYFMTKQTTTEWERFAAFAQKIIAVPKKVIDRRAEAYKKQRAAIRKAKA